MLRRESDVAQAIAQTIQLVLPQNPTSQTSEAYRVDSEASNAYLEGLHAWNLRTKAGFERAIVEFNRAITLDPNYALAYAALARTYSIAAIFRVGTSTENLRQAGDLARHALRIDDAIASAHSTIGFVHATLDYDWPAAEREFRRAIALNPSDPYAHLFYSNSYLSPEGRQAEAITEMNIAIRLDPLSPGIDSFLGKTYLLAGRLADAISHFQESLRRFPNFPLNH